MQPDADAAAGGASAGSSGSGGAGGVDGGHTSIGGATVGPGCYVLRSKANGLCLGQGAPTLVFGNPGFTLDFAGDCRPAGRIWQVAATSIPNVFSFQNLAQVPPPRFVLDVQKAAIQDGTAVITFGENGYDNQRFEVRARDPVASELRPQHHPQSCVAASATGNAQITTCDAADTNQAWFVQQSDCL